jgi:hypothetical protein
MAAVDGNFEKASPQKRSWKRLHVCHRGPRVSGGVAIVLVGLAGLLFAAVWYASDWYSAPIGM